jgi:hypothetical protein
MTTADSIPLMSLARAVCALPEDPLVDGPVI